MVFRMNEGMPLCLFLSAPLIRYLEIVYRNFSKEERLIDIALPQLQICRLRDFSTYQNKFLIFYLQISLIQFTKSQRIQSCKHLIQIKENCSELTDMLLRNTINPIEDSMIELTFLSILKRDSFSWKKLCFTFYFELMLTPQYGRGFLRVSDPQIFNMGFSNIAGTRVVSPPVMRASNFPLPPPPPFRPTSNDAGRSIQSSCIETEPSEPLKSTQNNESLNKSKSNQRPSGLKLVQKNRWKKEDVALRDQLQNTMGKLEVAKRNLKEFDELKRENKVLKAENKTLKEQTQKRKHEQQTYEQERLERMNKLQQYHQQQYTELMRKYTAVEKQKQMLRHMAMELESELKKAKEENNRLGRRVSEVIEINNRVREVETHYKNLEKQFQRDIEDWNEQKKKLENGLL